MNNAKMWLVVSPNVGVPIFLGAVAVGSFAVHVAVLSNTTWVSDFLSGNELGSGAQTAMVLDQAEVQNAGYVAQPTARIDGTQEVTIVLPDGTRAQAILQAPTTLAAAETDTAVRPLR